MNLQYRKALLSIIILWSVIIYPLTSLAGVTDGPPRIASKPATDKKLVQHNTKPQPHPRATPEGTKALMNPDRIEAGKSIPIIFTFTSCKKDWNDKVPVINTTDRELMEQSGIKIEGVRPIIAPAENENCTAFALISTLRTTPAINYKFNITIMDGPPHEITFRILGVQGLPPGPIPPDLDRPEVDIMWAVVPKKIVSDNFGPRVARNFYCIEVVIGNNSGYDLQVSAVGFRSGPVAEYATVMTTAHQTMAQKQKAVAEDASKKLKDKITLCGNEKDFAGCVTRETTPILDEMRRQSEADLETLRALNKTTTDASRLIYDNTIPVTGYPMARGSATRGEFWSIRNWTTRLLGMLGPIAIGFTPFLDVKNQKNFSNAVNLFTNPISEGYSNFWPDEFIPQLQRLDDQILREGRMITNNRQERTTVFIPKRILRLDNDKMVDDPVAITIALGRMVLIGNLVTYVNRVSVTSNPDDGEIGARPVVQPGFVNQFSIGTGTIAVTGASLEGAVIKTNDTGITIGVTSATRTSASAPITVDASALPGRHTLVLETPRGSVQLDINVVPPIPDILGSISYTPRPDERDQTPTAGRPVPQVFPFELRGTSLLGATLSPIRPSEPFVINITRETSDTQTLRGTVTIPAQTRGTSAGDRHNFRVTNANSDSQRQGDEVEITVNPPAGPAPTVANVVFDPPGDPRVHLTEPNTFEFDLTGTNLRFTRDIVPVTGSQRPSVTCDQPDLAPSLTNSNTAVHCRIVVPANFQVSGESDRYNYTLADGNGQTVDFPINILAARPITVNPVSGNQPERQAIPLTATNVEDVVVSMEDPLWKVEISERTPAGFSITISPKGNTSPATRRATIQFRNSDGSTTEDYVIPIVPLPTPTPAPSPSPSPSPSPAPSTSGFTLSVSVTVAIALLNAYVNLE